MRAARLAARALALLGPVSGPVAVVSPHSPGLAAALATRVRPVADGESPAAAVVVFLGAPARPADRQQVIRAVQTRLPADAVLVLVDHNQPRAWWRRVRGWTALAAAGLDPGRARYPAARELAALGFAVERLRLACGERVQLVAARRVIDPRPCLGSGTDGESAAR